MVWSGLKKQFQAPVNYKLSQDQSITQSRLECFRFSIEWVLKITSIVAILKPFCPNNIFQTLKKKLNSNFVNISMLILSQNLHIQIALISHYLKTMKITGKKYAN